MKKSGFILLDAIMASALISISVLAIANLNKQEDFSEDSLLAGKELAQLLHAVDKRVLLDGRANVDWNSAEAGVLVAEELRGNLIGNGNVRCPGTWDPKVKGNDDMALVDCDFWSNPPMGSYSELDVKSRNGLKEWRLDIYDPRPNYQDALMLSASDIIKSAELHSVLQMTGLYQYSVVDRGADSTVSPSECLKGGLDCAIRAELVFPESSVNLDSLYRVDGTNGMVKGLFFSINTKSAAVCFNSQSDPVDCGLDFDPLTEDLNVTMNRVNVSNIRLASKAEGVAVSCIDEAGKASFCGISPINTAQSEGFVQVNHVGVSGALSIVNTSGEEVFRVDENGVDSKVIELEGSVTAKNASVKDLELAGDLTTKIMTARSITSEGVFSTEHLKVDSVRMGGTCEKALAGSITTSSAGKLVSCRGGLWLEPPHPAGGVFYTRSKTCPAGFKSATNRNSVASLSKVGFSYTPSGGVSDSSRGSGVGGVYSGNHFAINKTLLPSHSHSYQRYTSDRHTRKSGSRNASWGGESTQTTTDTGGSKPIDITAPGIILTMCVTI